MTLASATGSSAGSSRASAAITAALPVLPALRQAYLDRQVAQHLQPVHEVPPAMEHDDVGRNEGVVEARDHATIPGTVRPRPDRILDDAVRGEQRDPGGAIVLRHCRRRAFDERQHRGSIDGRAVVRISARGPAHGFQSTA